MNGADLLQAAIETCQEIVRDASSGMSVCTKYEDAALIGWQQEHQLLGVRRLMLPLAARLGVSDVADKVFQNNLSRLDGLRFNSRELLQVPHDADAYTSGSASPSAV